MYAVIRTGGMQYRVSEGEVVRIPLMEISEGSEISLDDVLMISDGEKRNVGSPQVKGAKVKARVLRHGRGKKILVYTFKRRKAYEKARGHRQDFTEIQIDKILMEKPSRSKTDGS